MTGRKDFELYGSGRTDAGVHALGKWLTSTSARRCRRTRSASVSTTSCRPISISSTRASCRTGFTRGMMRSLAPTSIKSPGAAPPLPSRTCGGDASRWTSGGCGARRRSSWDVRLQVVRAAGRRARRWGPTLDSRARGPAGDADDSELVLLRIEGSHFLWKMVRRIVGVLVEVGRGNLPTGDAAAFLTTSSEVPARLTAPPSGLFLDRVYYKGDSRAAELGPPPRYDPQNNPADWARARAVSPARSSPSRLPRGWPSGTGRRPASLPPTHGGVLLSSRVPRPAEIAPRARTEPPCDGGAVARRHRRDRLAVKEQPTAVLRGIRPPQAREPPDEIRLALVGEARQVTPFVRDHEWLLKGQQPAHHQRFQEEGIGHPFNAGRAKYGSSSVRFGCAGSAGRSICSASCTAANPDSRPRPVPPPVNSSSAWAPT